MIDPKLQTELSVIIQWRQHCFVYIADIEKKMYRQILIDPRDRLIAFFGVPRLINQ